MTHLVIGNILYGVLIFLRVLSDIIFFYCVLSWFVMPLNRLFEHGLLKAYRSDGSGGRAWSAILRGLQKFVNALYTVLRRFIDPLAAPFRRLCDIMFRGGTFLDFSILFLFFAIRIAQRIVVSLYYSVMFGI